MFYALQDQNFRKKFYYVEKFFLPMTRFIGNSVRVTA